jgi:hypothetical protein
MSSNDLIIFIFTIKGQNRVKNLVRSIKNIITNIKIITSIGYLSTLKEQYQGF